MRISNSIAELRQQIHDDLRIKGVKPGSIGISPLGLAVTKAKNEKLAKKAKKKLDEHPEMGPAKWRMPQV
jgi:hypothetical protein